MLCRQLCDTRWRVVPRGFTLIELLVVLTIITIVTLLAAPVLRFGSLANQEAARLVQGALVGARDAAINRNVACGIRLLPDESLPPRRLTSGEIDPTSVLIANRIIPLEQAPDYTEGRVTIR